MAAPVLNDARPITDGPPAPSIPAGYHALPRRDLILTIVGLMLGLFLAALDQTIVGTAMPRVVAELQGFQHYAWVTTAYLLTSTTVVPISGKLSDMYGRKIFLLGSAAGFIAASALCGLSQDMTQLIVFRGLQGMAGGVLTSTVFTVISQIFPPAERPHPGRLQRNVWPGQHCRATAGRLSHRQPELAGCSTSICRSG